MGLGTNIRAKLLIVANDIQDDNIIINLNNIIPIIGGSLNDI